jgi:hypothetical protein
MKEQSPISPVDCKGAAPMLLLVMQGSIKNRRNRAQRRRGPREEQETTASKRPHGSLRSIR